MQLIVNGVVLVILAIINELCYLVWRAITYARISKEVLGMVEGGSEPRTS